MTKGKRKERRLAVKADNAYIRRDEHMMCRTPGCRNVIAVWATGSASNGYCASCREK